MPTDEERREVAARLRNYENLRESFRESPICAFLDALGVEYLDWKGVCKRLAELIEPEPEIDKRESIRCPNCGTSNYGVNYLTSTLIGWTPRYVDGVQVNKDPNKTTKHCTCFSCGSDFEYEVD